MLYISFRFEAAGTLNGSVNFVTFDSRQRNVEQLFSAKRTGRSSRLTIRSSRWAY
jgi:hypothetical protein